MRHYNGKWDVVPLSPFTDGAWRRRHTRCTVPHSQFLACTRINLNCTVRFKCYLRFAFLVGQLDHYKSSKQSSVKQWPRGMFASDINRLCSQLASARTEYKRLLVQIGGSICKLAAAIIERILNSNTSNKCAHVCVWIANGINAAR